MSFLCTAIIVCVVGYFALEVLAGIWLAVKKARHEDEQKHGDQFRRWYPHQLRNTFWVDFDTMLFMSIDADSGDQEVRRIGPDNWEIKGNGLLFGPSARQVDRTAWRPIPPEYAGIEIAYQAHLKRRAGLL